MGDERYICLVPSIVGEGRVWTIWYDTQLMEITHGVGSDPTVWPPYNSHNPELWKTHGWTSWFHPHAITAYEMVMEMQKTGKIQTPPPPPWYKSTGEEDKRYENAD